MFNLSINMDPIFLQGQSVVFTSLGTQSLHFATSSCLFVCLFVLFLYSTDRQSAQSREPVGHTANTGMFCFT